MFSYELLDQLEGQPALARPQIEKDLKKIEAKFGPEGLNIAGYLLFIFAKFSKVKEGKDKLVRDELINYIQSGEFPMPQWGEHGLGTFVTFKDKDGNRRTLSPTDNLQRNHRGSFTRTVIEAAFGAHRTSKAGGPTGGPFRNDPTDREIVGNHIHQAFRDALRIITTGTDLPPNIQRLEL